MWTIAASLQLLFDFISDTSWARLDLGGPCPTKSSPVSISRPSPQHPTHHNHIYWLIPDVSVNNVIWAQVESCCSVIAGCLPTYGPLIRSSSFSEFVSSVFKSLLKSLKRKSTTWSSKRDQTDAWYPLSENHGNSATVGNSSKVVLTEDDGIHVQRSLDINVQRHNTQV